MSLGFVWLLPTHRANENSLEMWVKVLRMKNVLSRLRLKCSLGKQLPAWDPGKVKLPGLSAKKNDCKTRPENLTNKILEFYPNSCSSPSRIPDALGSDGCCNTKFEVSPVGCQKLAPRDKDRTVALLMGAENNPPPHPPPNLSALL